jgi:hypothetical protein
MSIPTREEATDRLCWLWLEALRNGSHVALRRESVLLAAALDGLVDATDTEQAEAEFGAT